MKKSLSLILLALIFAIPSGVRAEFPEPEETKEENAEIPTTEEVEEASVDKLKSLVLQLIDQLKETREDVKETREHVKEAQEEVKETKEEITTIVEDMAPTAEEMKEEEEARKKQADIQKRRLLRIRKAGPRLERKRSERRRARTRRIARKGMRRGEHPTRIGVDRKKVTPTRGRRMPKRPGVKTERREYRR